MTTELTNRLDRIKAELNRNIAKWKNVEGLTPQICHLATQRDLSLLMAIDALETIAAQRDNAGALVAEQKLTSICDTWEAKP